MYSAVNLYSDDVVVDVITIQGNRNFHLRIFVKVRFITSGIKDPLHHSILAGFGVCECCGRSSLNFSFSLPLGCLATKRKERSLSRVLIKVRISKILSRLSLD
jgi:hypothetical protein